MIAGAFEAHEAGHRPTALGALAAEIKPEFQGRGLADKVLDGMAYRRARGRAQPPDRAGPSELQGPLPDHPD